jgi:tRNA (adenine57-N1/adenine58-N1)-methyltransferase
MGWAMDPLVLLDRKGQRFFVPAGRGTVSVDGLGVVDVDALRDRLGKTYTVGRRTFLVLAADRRDLLHGLRRKAQIVGSKDAAAILYACDVGAGQRVVEVGSGSGALTVVLARTVLPGGRVFSYDIRDDFLALVRENVARAGLSEAVTFRLADATAGIEEEDVDAVVVDIPAPWDVVDAAYAALKPCGHFASFSPNVEQVKETVRALRSRPFVGVRTVELIEREMEVREVGVRPGFAPLGHTGYLTFARKVLETG